MRLTHIIPQIALTTLGAAVIALIPHSSSAHVPAAVVATLLASRSVVFVSASPEKATAFAIHTDSAGTYFLTTAHLINKDDWLGNPSPRDRLTVMDPFSGEERWDAQIVGQPDFARDVMLFRVPMTRRFESLCLATLLPEPGWPLAITTFSATTDIPIPSRPNPPPPATVPDSQSTSPFPKLIVVRTGNIGSAAGLENSIFDFSAQIEQGYSGAPILDALSGLVIGIVREKPKVPSENGAVRDPKTGTLTPPVVVSTDSRYGSTPDAIQNLLNQAKFSSTRVKWNRRVATPDLALARRLDLTLVEDVRVPGAQEDFRDLRSLLLRITGAAFDADVDLHTIAQRSVANPVADEIGGADACASDALPARATIFLRIDPTPNAKRVAFRTVITDCDGNRIFGTDEMTSSLSNAGLKRSDFDDFKKVLTSQLASMAGPGADRLKRLAIDGVPLADGERSAGLTVSVTNGTPVVTDAWSKGSAGLAGIKRDDAIVSMGPYNAASLATRITTAGWAQVADEWSAAGDGGWMVSWKANTGNGATKSATMSVRDRCAFLQPHANDVLFRRYDL